MIKVLIIEDEYTIADVLREIVQFCGAGVCGIASNGIEAITLALEHKPDLILTDIRLHGELDGLETILKIREHFLCEVAVMSGHITPKIRAKIDIIKPFAIINKPYDLNRISNLIKEFTAMQKSEKMMSVI